MTGPASPDGGPSVRVLQRVVLPSGHNLDVVPLYVETVSDRGVQTPPSRADADGGTATAAIGQTQSNVRFGDSLEDEATEDRRRAAVRAGQRVSFATYFNAFPASYWKRWTDLDSVTLRLRVSGAASVMIYQSNARGQSHPVETIHVDTDGVQSVERTLPLRQFIDGGWYWFDIAAGTRDATLHDAEWVGLTDRTRRGRVSVGITTFNRPEYCVELLRTLAAAPDVLDVLDAVYLVDQGTQHPADHADFADAVKPLGERMHDIRQPNLGGSGGFSRAMHDTVSAGDSDYLLLLDDDVVLEPEGILRAVAFADLARRPTLVGGHMFSMHDRSVLHAFGESVAAYPFWWGAHPQTEPEHDFGRRGLRHTPWLHRRIDVDYNGWWMCLIPVSVIREIGLALPVFIKWDDAEYGLRARAAEHPTVSLPGMAVWHVPWQDKNDAVDWQAYYHVRNRALAALLHSPYEHGGAFVSESLQVQLQHLLSMQYSTAALRVLALEDLLSGPDHLHRQLAGKPGELRTLRAGFPDARTAGDVEEFPAVRRRKPPRRGKQTGSPRNPVSLVLKAAKGSVRQLGSVDARARQHPQALVPYQDAGWWRLANMDSALVSSADGAGTAWYQRDPAQFRSLLRRSAALHARLLREWPRLSRDYRAAAAEFTSPAAWAAAFEPVNDDRA